MDWIEGDVFDAPLIDDLMSEIDVVISTVGSFGTNAAMERSCGDATIAAIRSARAAGSSSSSSSSSVSAFAFISSAQVGGPHVPPPSGIMGGYFNGKARVEQSLRESFSNSFVIARPGFVYGPRMINGTGPYDLSFAGKSMNVFGNGLGPISGLIRGIPFVGRELSSAVPVRSLAEATIRSLLEVRGGEGDVIIEGEERGKGGRILTAEDIRKF